MLITNLSDYHPLENLLTRFGFQNLPSPSSIITTAKQSDALNLMVGLVHPDTIRFTYKLLKAQFSSLVQERETVKGFFANGFLFTSSTYIRKTYHRDVQSEISCLIELGILEATHPIKGKCRGFKVIWAELVTAFLTPITRETPKRFFNLSTPKKRHSPSDIAQDTKRSIPVGKTNLFEVIRYFESKLERLETDWNYLLTELGYILGCWDAREDWDEVAGILTYRQSFHTTNIGGRVFAKSGDALVSRELKRAWFKIPKAVNYDIKAAHVAIFNQLYPTDFGSKWILDNGFRQSIATQVGVSVQTVKLAVLSLTYGGSLRAQSYKNKAWEDIYCSIFQSFVNELGQDGALLAIERFKALTSDYQAALKLWHQEIAKNPKKWQRNQIGLVTDEVKPETLTSHYLQGKEQEAIRWISNRQNQRIGGYQVISNQYDGLIVIGSIPDKLLEDFQLKYGLVFESKSL